jgi:hypothetical protein
MQKKSFSRVALVDLLRRKRTNLQKFLHDSGIVTYELLIVRCNSMGVLPPTLLEFQSARGAGVLHEISSPTEGIIVLEPPPLPEIEEMMSIVSEDEITKKTKQLQKKKKMLEPSSSE